MIQRKAAAARGARVSCRLLLSFVSCCGAAGAVFADAPAGASRWSLLEDNDGMVTHDDKHYTQGFRFSDLLPEPEPGGMQQGVLDAAAAVLPPYREAAGDVRRMEWIALGQSIFTPSDTHRNPPDPKDRPYAGWLYTGLALFNEHDGQGLDSLELLGGVVGPWALARQAQNTFHRVFSFGNSYGWSSQLANRGAVQFSFDRKQRFSYRFNRGPAIDAIPEAGFSVGNVFRYVDAGAMLRFGNALDVDYGPERIRPAASGTGWFNERADHSGGPRFYLFTGMQTRWVFENVFLDGATGLGLPGLARKPAVTDFYAGGAFLFAHDLRADFSATRRGREFGSQGADDIFGSASLTLSL